MISFPVKAASMKIYSARNPSIIWSPYGIKQRLKHEGHEGHEESKDEPADPMA
jgi:hypothetical protein